MRDWLLDLKEWQFIALLIGGDLLLGGLVWSQTGSFAIGASVATVFNLTVTLVLMGGKR